MLQIQSVKKAFVGGNASHRVQAIDNVSLEVKAGEFVAIQGPSGCGKTTLLLASGGLLQPDSGLVLVGGEDIYSLDSEARSKLRARKIGFVFQQFHLVPYLSALDNVLAPSLALPGNGTRERAEELLVRFGLQDRMHHVPAELSTGERQRTALARALLNRAGLLLADEPTGNLDEGNGRSVLQYMADFAKQGGAVFLVTHDPKVAEFAGRLLRMKDGKLVLP